MPDCDDKKDGIRVLRVDVMHGQQCLHYLV